MFGSKSGGLFDFNGDGEVSFTEKFLAYNIFEEITNADGGNCSSYDEDDDDDEDDDEPAPAPAPAENPAQPPKIWKSTPSAA